MPNHTIGLLYDALTVDDPTHTHTHKYRYKHSQKHLGLIASAGIYWTMRHSMRSSRSTIPRPSSSPPPLSCCKILLSDIYENGAFSLSVSRLSSSSAHLSLFLCFITFSVCFSEYVQSAWVNNSITFSSMMLNCSYIYFHVSTPMNS